VRRHAVLITLLVSELLVGALSAGFQLGVRPTVLDAFHRYATEIPPATRVALAPWLLPVANGATFLVTIAALAAPLRRSQRGPLIAAGLVLSSAALVFAVLAAFMPIFNPS
jgi:hypothetical protein